MIKFLIKLALAGLIAYGTWHVGAAYAGDYRFRDAAREAALTPRVTDAQLRARLLDLASENGAPVEDGTLEIRRSPAHIYIDVAYEVPVDVLPWYRRSWPFSWTIDVYVVSSIGLVPKTPNP